MADPQNNPARPDGPPKYLPRIKYTPPEPVSLDGDADEGAEENAGEHPASQAAKSKDATPPASPGRPASRIVSKSKDSQGTPGTSPRPLNTAAPNKPARSVGKARSKIDDADDGRTGVLIEATPEAETFEGRRRIRLIIGGIAGGAIFLALFMIYRSLTADNGPEIDEDQPPPPFVTVPPAPKKSAATLQAEAERLLAEARALEKADRAQEALTRVERVIADYSETQAAKVALAAQDRFKQGLPLFVEGAAVIATKADPLTNDAQPGGDNPAPGPGEASPAMASNNPDAAATAPGTPEAPPPAGIAPMPLAPAVGKVASHPLPFGYQPVVEAGVHASGWPLKIVGGRDHTKMVLVPGDQFTQGRDNGPPAEAPAHRVQLSTYYIDQHEVTNAQYSAFRPGVEINDLPVVKVSYEDAREFARWAGRSLPTEAQWEMAARTSDGRTFPWGNAIPDFGGDRVPRQIDTIMSFEADQSPYGVYDLSGNAWEWTNDWYDMKYYSQLKGQVAQNPTGAARGAGRTAEVVIKGGSKEWDCIWRMGLRPDTKLPHLGFRCVLNLDQVAQSPQNAPAPNAPAANAPADQRNPRVAPPANNGAVPF